MTSRKPTPPVRPVLSVVAAVRTTDTLGPYAGTIEPRYKSDLGFRIFGRMVARFVDVGAIVTKDQELAALDPAVQALGGAQRRGHGRQCRGAVRQRRGRGRPPARPRPAQHHAAGPVRADPAQPRDRRGQPDARAGLAAQGQGPALLHPAQGRLRRRRHRPLRRARPGGQCRPEDRHRRPARDPRGGDRRAQRTRRHAVACQRLHHRRSISIMSSP